MLDGPGVNGEQIILEQAYLISRALGTSEEDAKRERAERERLFRIVNGEPDDAVARDKIRAAIEAGIAAMGEAQRKAAGTSDEALQGRVQAAASEMLTPWFRFFLKYDPAPTLARIRVPVLAVWGEKDLHVPPTQSLAPVEKALTAAGVPHKAVVLPGLNHLLQTARAGSPTEYAQIEETMSPAALQVIGDWIVEHTGLAAGTPH